MTFSTAYRQSIAVLVCTVASALFLAEPALAAPGTATTPDATVSCTIPDVALDGPGFVDLTATCTYAKLGANPSQVLLSWDLFPDFGGTNDSPEFSWEIDFEAPAQATVTSEAWPISGQGDSARRSVIPIEGFLLTSNLSGAGNSRADFTGGSFTVTRSVSKVTRLKVRQDARFVLPTRIRARVLATNSTGKTVPIDGDVRVEGRIPGGRTWSVLGPGVLGSDGWFEAAAPRLPRGTQIRVSVVDCGWCTNASAQRALR